jgi:hypothetical protein
MEMCKTGEAEVRLVDVGVRIAGREREREREANDVIMCVEMFSRAEVGRVSGRMTEV